MWDNLKASIASVVRTNNNQEITGANLQNVLNTIVNSIGANATFAGVATPSTNPGTPDGPVFWIAGPGTYSNFGQLTVVGDVLGVFVWSDSAWHYDSILSLNIDDEPTAGSENVVKSGGVWNLNRAIIVADTIYNGTPNNHRNTGSVRTSPIRVINGTHIIIYTDRPLSAEGNYYTYPKYYKDKNGTVILNESSYSANKRIQEVPYGAYTTEIGFAEKTAEGVIVPLRTTDFENYNIYIIAFPSELFERISALESSVDNIESLIATLDNLEKEVRSGYVFDTIERSYIPRGNTSRYASITFGLMKDHTYRFTFESESSFSGTQLNAKIIDNDAYSLIKTFSSNLLSGGSWDGSAKSYVYTHSADLVGDVAVGSYGSRDLTIEGTGEIKVTIEDITISNLVNEDTPSEETSILDLNPAKEYLTKIKTLRRHDYQYQYAPNDVTIPFVLLHFSDIHGVEYNMQRIKEWWDEYSNYIDGVINTGDNVPTKWTGDISYLINNGGDKILNVIGNHDVADPAVSSNMYNGNVPHTDIYAKFMSGLMDDTELGVIRPANASMYGYCFYYKDFTNRGNVQGQNLRVIVSDSVIQDRQWLTNAAHDRSYYEAELAWLEDVLADARANNLTVIIASHYGPQINTQIHDAKGFSFVDNTVNDSYGIHVAFHQKVQDFIDTGGKFVCWLCGHRHLDAFGTVDGYPQQIAITVTTAAYSVYRNLHYYQVDRAQDDKSADAFNMIGIDTEHKLLRVLRIGSNYDGYFRPCDALTVDYSNLNNIKVWA